MYFASY